MNCQWEFEVNQLLHDEQVNDFVSKSGSDITWWWPSFKELMISEDKLQVSYFSDTSQHQNNNV